MNIVKLITGSHKVLKYTHDRIFLHVWGVKYDFIDSKTHKVICLHAFDKQTNTLVASNCKTTKKGFDCKNIAYQTQSFIEQPVGN